MWYRKEGKRGEKKKKKLVCRGEGRNEREKQVRRKIQKARELWEEMLKRENVGKV